MFKFLSRIFKPKPRLAFDISNFWLNEEVSDAEAIDLFSQARAAGYSGVMIEAGIYPALTQQQLRCALQAGLWADIYPWMHLSKSPEENQTLIRKSLIQGFAGLVWLDFEETPPEGLDVPEFVRTMVNWCWDNNLRPAIYTRRGWWMYEMGNSNEFSYLALWDADPDGLANAKESRDDNGRFIAWVPYGGWKKRVWKQFAWNKSVAGMNADLSTEWV